MATALKSAVETRWLPESSGPAVTGAMMMLDPLGKSADADAPDIRACSGSGTGAELSSDLRISPGTAIAGLLGLGGLFGGGGVFALSLLNAAMVAGLAAIHASEAAAQDPGFQPTAPAVALREPNARVLCRSDDGREFVVERQGSVARLKFTGSEEVLALRIIPGPRGDELFKTDTDDVVLRLTILGGITLYTTENPNGSPVVEQAGAEAIAPAARSAAGLQAAYDHFASELARAGAALKLHVSPEAGAFPEETADAALVAARGVRSVPAANLTSLRIERGTAPAVEARGKTLVIQIAPELGYAGRPSAAAVKRAIEAERAARPARPAPAVAGK